MALTEALGRDLSNYIKSLLNKNVAVIDEQKRCLISSNTEEIGEKINLPDETKELTSYREIELGGTTKTLIPLRHKVKNIGYLLFNETSEDIKKYNGLIKSFAELLIQQHYENNKPILDSTDQYFLKILNDLNLSNVSEFDLEAKLLGYDLSQKRIAIVIHLRGFWDKCLLDFDQASFERDEVIKNWKRNIEQSFNSFFTKNADLLIAYAGNDKFVAFKAVEESEQNLHKLLKKSFNSIFDPLKSYRIDSLTIGYGNAYTGAQGLLNAFKEADLSLELGERMWGENRSYFFGDLGILSILGEGDREKKLNFSNQLLGKLKNEELSKTLECFFENNLNLTETAEKMGIHRNTVIYRLNQITKMLDADPRIFEQAMMIKIALLVRGLFG